MMPFKTIKLDHGSKIKKKKEKKRRRKIQWNELPTPETIEPNKQRMRNDTSEIKMQ